MTDMVAAIGKQRLRRVGYEPAMMSCEAFQSLEGRMPAKSALVAVRGWIEELRMVKSPSEIAAIRRSVDTNSQAFEQGAAGAGGGARVPGRPGSRGPGRPRRDGGARALPGLAGLSARGPGRGLGPAGPAGRGGAGGVVVGTPMIEDGTGTRIGGGAVVATSQVQ